VGAADGAADRLGATAAAGARIASNDCSKLHGRGRLAHGRCALNGYQLFERCANGSGVMRADQASTRSADVFDHRNRCSTTELYRRRSGIAGKTLALCAGLPRVEARSKRAHIMLASEAMLTTRNPRIRSAPCTLLPFLNHPDVIPANTVIAGLHR